jgi:hypothetical protein
MQGMDFRIYLGNEMTPDFYTKCAGSGIKAVVSGQDTECIKKCRENGLDYYICSGAFGCSDSRYFCRDVHDRAVPWFGSGCPNHPALIEKNLSDIRMLAGIEGIRGIIIDGARFASLASAEGIFSFFTCFCQDCLRKMDKWGIDAAAVKNSVLALYDLVMCGKSFNLERQVPYLMDWLTFRRLCVSAHFVNIRQAIQDIDPHVELGAYIFTPMLSRLVGQDYSDLASVCDFLSPMIYRYYPHEPGPACLDHEIGMIASFIDHQPAAAATIIELFKTLTGTDFSRFGSSAVLKEKGVEQKHIVHEAVQACELAGDAKISPIILLDDVFLADTLTGCSKAPVKRIDFFRYEPNAFERALPLLQTFAKGISVIRRFVHP